MADQLERIRPSAPIDDIWDVVERDGAVIVEQLLSADVIDRLNAELDAPLNGITAGARNPKLNFFFGARTKRFTDLIVASPTFRDVILQHPVIIGLADKVMTQLSDSYWLNTTQIIEIGPGNARQVLHRDMTNYPVFVPLGPAAPHVMMNFLIALTEFREDNGGTRIIPGSNRWPDYLDLDDERDFARTIPVDMRAGDCVLLSGKVIHGGGANTTTDEHRRALALGFSPGFLVPEQAFPFEVPLDLARTLPPKVQQMIGFRSFHNSSNLGGSLWQHNYEELADHLDLR